MVNFNAIIETINVKINAIKYTPKLANVKLDSILFPFINSKQNPPTIMGMLSKKLNSDAWDSSVPLNTILEIVLPERDKPGTTAKPCTKPTNIDFLIETSPALTDTARLWYK